MQAADTADAFKQQLDNAVAQHRAGNLTAAETLYRQILEGNPAHAKALGLLGLIEHDKGRTEAGIDLLRRSIDADPSNSNTRVNLGTVYAESGRLDAAIEEFQQALLLDPTHLNALNNVVKALRGRGRTADSLPYLEQLVALQPESAEARHALGVTLCELGQFDRAATELDRAALKGARIPGLNYQRGLAHFASRNLDAARPLLESALREAPRNFDALYMLGSLHHEQGRLDDAKTAFDKALLLNPDHADLHHAFGQLHASRFDHSAAIASFGRAAAAKPGFADALADLSTSHWTVGDEPQARAALAQSLKHRPDPHLQVALDLMIPQIMGTHEEMLASRGRYETNLDALLENPPALSLPHSTIGNSNFYLAYHGIGDRSLLEKYAKFCLAACPPLAFTAPHCGRERPRNRPMRVGFLSQFIYHHSVSVCFSKVVETMAATSEFDVHLISRHPVDDAAVNAAYPNFTGRKVQLTGTDFIAMRDTIAALELDMLIYLDIGMDLVSYFLATARLAPIQCVLGGHPDTTGISTIDYFLSSALTELPEADDHYSEKLLRLPISTFYFQRPQFPLTAFGYKKTRADFGLPAAGRLYLCPTKLHKVHPDFDAALGRILELDPTGHVVLFKEPQFAAWSNQLAARFARTLPEALRKRIVFAPWIVDALDFANVNMLADVILDPFHFGIGSTAMTTCAVGVPTVTLPSRFLRGRTGHFFCTLLDLPECIAVDAEDYARKAVSIATNRDLRTELGSRILRNNHVLYDNMRPIHDLVDTLKKL